MSQNKAINADSFRGWFNSHYDKDECRCICEYGASYGPPGLIFYSQTNAFYERFENEVWELAIAGDISLEDLDDMGALSDPVRFKNAMVWAAAETLAFEKYFQKGGRK